MDDLYHHITSFESLLQRRQLRDDILKLVISTLIASAIYSLRVFVPESFQSYLENISAGIYGAALTYTLVERRFQERRTALESASRIATYWSRMNFLVNSSVARMGRVERNVNISKRLVTKASIISLDKALETLRIVQRLLTDFESEYKIVEMEVQEAIHIFGIVKDIQTELKAFPANIPLDREIHKANSFLEQIQQDRIHRRQQFQEVNMIVERLATSLAAQQTLM